MNMRLIVPAFLALCCAGTWHHATAAPLDELEVVSLDLVSTQRVGRAVFQYGFELTVENTGEAVDNLTVSLAASGPGIQIVDGVSVVGSVEALGTATSDDVVVIQLQRTVPFDPESLIWSFDGDREDGSAELSLVTSPSSIEVSVGGFTNIASTLALEGVVDQVTIEQTVFPPIGLDIDPTIDGQSFDGDSPFSTVLNQELFAATPGTYAITTQVTADDGELMVESVVEVVVLGVDDDALVLAFPPSFLAEGISVGGSVESVVTARVTGVDPASISSVRIEGIDNESSYTLQDDGVVPDLIGGNGVYSAEVIIEAGAAAAGECIQFVAVAEGSFGTASSPAGEICVSNFPIGLESVGLDTIANAGFDGPGGIRVSSELGQFSADPEANEDDILAAVQSAGATVTGSSPSLSLYQVRFDPAPVSLEALVSSLITLESSESVKSADLVYFLDNSFDYSTNDPLEPQQSHIDVVRGDEARFVARGKGVVVAVIDSGVDLDHPDLQANLLAGFDFVDGDSIPNDTFGHGTSVAGVIAAIADNSIGGAGIAPEAKILPVRVGTSMNGKDLIDLSWVVSGINAASAAGADVLNISLGQAPNVDGDLLCKLAELFGLPIPASCIADSITSGATTYTIDAYCAVTSKAIAGGSVVIAGAGNEDSQNREYPAACPGVIAVAATDDSDNIANFSNTGSWVDLAAPGVQVLTTSLGGGFGRVDGTSFSAPVVAGVAALIIGRSDVAMSPAAVETRLRRTAVPLGSSTGDGRVDAFEAVFNGSFEEGNLALWERFGTVGSFTQLGATLFPQDRERMGYVSTGPAAARTAGSLSQRFDIMPGVTSLPISFTYAFISEEFPEFVGTQFDDSLRITITGPNGQLTELASESINSSSFFELQDSTLDFPGGDNTIGWTGWRDVSVLVPVSDGSGEYLIELEDAGDAIFDTVLLIDSIRME